MTLENACLSALAAVVSALCYLFGLLWKRSQQCETWRAEKEPLIREMSEKLGALNSAMSFFRQCKTPQCMFTGMDGETFSIKKINNPPHHHP